MSHSRSRETAEVLFRLTQRPKNSENVNPPSDIQRKRDEVHKMAQANRAFAHFRW